MPGFHSDDQLQTWLEEHQLTASQIFDRWLELDAPFLANTSHGTPQRPPVKGIATKSNVVLTAPHAISFTPSSSEVMKLADLHTGGLAALVAELTGCSYVANVWDCPDISRLKGLTPIEEWLAENELWSYPTWIIDLHGCRDSHGAEIFIGTGKLPMSPKQERLLAATLRSAARFEDLHALHSLKKFNAASGHTVVTRTKNNSSATPIQLEFSRSCRSPLERLDKSLAAVGFLHQLVLSLDSISLP